MPIRVLFLCTANAARSIMAEALLRRAAHADFERASSFEVASAGTHPGGIHPLTARVLREHGIDPSQFNSESTDVVLDEDFDYVITLCDNAAQQCPTFPGRAERLHWSIEDPAAATSAAAAATGTDDDQLAAFRRAYADINHRIAAFIPLARRTAARRARRLNPRIPVLA